MKLSFMKINYVENTEIALFTFSGTPCTLEKCRNKIRIILDLYANS